MNARLFVIGDLQGCAPELERWLETVGFRTGQDRLVAVGDLVARGPDSLRTLRTLRALGAEAVLGNHDLHLIGCAAGVRMPDRDLRRVLDAPDAAEILDWLRTRPLVLPLGERWAVVHAGLAPHWGWAEIHRHAAAIRARLSGPDWRAFIRRAFSAPTPPSEPEAEEERLVFALAVFTRARYCTQEGAFDWETRAGAPRSDAFRPWFAHPRLAWRGARRVIFGHWAALGPVLDQPHVLGLDGGCVWGGRLIGAEISGEKPRLWMVDCPGYRKIGEE